LLPAEKKVKKLFEFHHDDDFWSMANVMKISINSLTIRTWSFSMKNIFFLSSNIHHNKKKDERGMMYGFSFSASALREHCVNSKGKKGIPKSSSIYCQ
jgi:hypothetical protein